MNLTNCGACSWHFGCAEKCSASEMLLVLDLKLALSARVAELCRAFALRSIANGVSVATPEDCMSVW
jgi:hypothetical protein